MSSLKKTSRSQPRFWRSLNELQNSDDFRRYVEGEFPESSDAPPDSASRRRFVQLMGASFALAGGAASCRWPREELRPYTRRPEGLTPGVPKVFATAMELSGIGGGINVESFDGRPTKIEGNPSHPTSRGKSTVHQQAAILELYDPDRSHEPMTKGEAGKSSLKAFGTWAEPHFRALLDQRGEGLAILAEASSSPTRSRLQREIASRFPEASWHVYEAVNRDNDVRGAKIAFGRATRTHADLSSAKVIFAVEADLFDNHADAQRMSRDWAENRNPETGEMNRLYAIESRISNTGAVADHRLPVRSEQVKPFVMALESAIRNHPTVQASVTDLQSPAAPPSSGFLVDDKTKTWIAELVKDLVAHRGRSAVVVGSSVEAEVHAIVHRINRALGNVDKTIRYTSEPLEVESNASMRELIASMTDGRIKTLVVMGVNPVYSVPEAMGFTAALSKVETLVHLGEHRDETGALANWHVPRSNFLESWGDTRAYDGTVTVVQPLIDPLHFSLSDLELMSMVLGRKPNAQNEVRKTFAALRGLSLETDAQERRELDAKLSEAEGQGVKMKPLLTTVDRAWRAALDAGVVDGTAYFPETPGLLEFEVNESEPSSLRPSAELGNGELELTFYPDPAIYDGRFANNGWLQELPDYITKLAWDNAALFSPATAKALGVKDEDVVSLTAGKNTIEAAALVIPGQATNSVAIAMGYGRNATGRLGAEYDPVPYETGFSVTPMLPADGSMRVSGLQVKKTGKRYPLAATQDHWAIDDLGLDEREKRSKGLVRSTDLKHYKEDPKFVEHYEHGPSGFKLYTHPAEFEGHRWAMAIDLSKCTGCNVCTIACQSENNIPVVGKESVRRGREMHWIRIDRYFQGDPEDAQVVAQPLTCMQCENAPCEQVCPVAATVHDEEGLNAMVYNRCIGTRYCSNNCPFKVRRFNWFQYHEADKNPTAVTQHMMYNPEVTVRYRGVMEKCTYCTQRIQSAKITAKVEKRPLKDGDIVTACQQACPSEAIVFGDLNDKKSQVSELHARARSYGLLNELNLNVRTQYLAKITNPNENLAPKQDDHGGHH